MSYALLAVGIAAVVAVGFVWLKPTTAETTVTRTMQIRTLFSSIITLLFVVYAIQSGSPLLIAIAAVAVALGVAWVLVERPYRGALQ